MNWKLHLWTLAVATFVCAAVACAQNPSKAVAIVNGESITQDQLDKAASSDMERLEQKRQQFLVQLERDKKSAMEDALEEIVNERLLTAEAKKRNLSVDDLVRAEVQDKVTAPDEDTIRKFYDDNKAVIKGSFVETALEIRNYLMQQGRDNAFSTLLAKLRKDYGYKSLLEPDRAKVETQGHPARGPAAAPVTIVEFSDFECPYCGGLYPTLKRVEASYKDKIRIVYRQFPLNNLHPHAQKAAEASLCANEQNQFWQLHDAMFTDQKNLTIDDLKAKASKLSLNNATFATCLDSGKYANAIRDSIDEGSKLGVDGTPAMFINGRFLGGNQPYDAIAKIIDDELSRSGQ
jgi:protein-disulfide isomerase/Skp family chaperone for outer membrane proteins